MQMLRESHFISHNLSLSSLSLSLSLSGLHLSHQMCYPDGMEYIGYWQDGAPLHPGLVRKGCSLHNLQKKVVINDQEHFRQAALAFNWWINCPFCVEDFEVTGAKAAR